MDDESRVVEAFDAAMKKHWDRYPQLREYSFDSGLLSAIGEDAAAQAVSNLFWKLALGDCTTARRLADHVGRAAEEIVGEVASGHLIGLIGRHETLLPLWQFDKPGSPQPSEGAEAVLEVFRSALGPLFSPETVVLWAATTQPELGDQEPREAIMKVPIDDLRWSAQVTAAKLGP
ncbi:hypothetical protein ACFXHD_02455 [Streptomyces hydrogenans]|uniref:hypothetical protein n=1 Tax=Streptomyces hydrogenans TaxID=1873719 RepID=UPI0036C18174